jgi:hypothetical protein
MFRRISRTLLPIGQAVYEARATLRTSAGFCSNKASCYADGVKANALIDGTWRTR